MLIDSHAHYAHARYDTEFSCLSFGKDGYFVARHARASLIAAMRDSGICSFIEPSIDPGNIEEQLAIVSTYGGFAAIGVHPKIAASTKLAARRKLLQYAKADRVIAIGETSLDYHLPNLQKQKWKQKRWFITLVKLAHRLKLPLILHVRDADRDALKVLNRYKRCLHGGVAHCFSGNIETANQYIALGFSIGIGGSLLTSGDRAANLRNTVRNVPLKAILVETDAPYVLPDIGELGCSKSQRKKLVNSSLILPRVIGEIADIKGMLVSYVEDEIYKNTVRVFDL